MHLKVVMELDPCVNKMGNKWEFKSILMDQKQKKSTKESRGKTLNISTNTEKTMQLDTDDLRSHKAQIVKAKNENSYKASLTHAEVHTIRSKYSSLLLF